MELGSFTFDFFDARSSRIPLEPGELAPFTDQGRLELPQGLTSFNENRPGRTPAHYLRISSPSEPDWRTYRFTGQDRLTFHTEPPPKDRKPPLVLVYFLNSYMSSGFMDLAMKQLSHLTRSGLIDQPHAFLHLVLLGDQAAGQSLVAGMKRLGIRNYRLSTYQENNHEFHGIRTAHELAQEYPNAYILYFHGKGITRLKPGTHWKPKSYERFLFPEIIDRWRKNIRWLDHLESCEKAGLYCGGRGHAWFNFWWVKASYLRTLPPPQRMSDRYYYESWLGHPLERGDTNDRCCSIGSSPLLGAFNAGTNYTPEAGNMTLRHWRWWSLAWWYLEHDARR